LYYRKDEGFSVEFAAAVKLPFKDDEHPLCGISLTEYDVSRLKDQLFTLPEEPLDLVFGKVGEYGNAS
jgi:hypothetical protein